ncbi:MAG: hypothetical protein AABZ60_06870, partial [Planctomycetota bacterium]
EAKSINKITGGELNWSKGHLPKVFTHYGCNMLATILESELAIEKSIQIIRAFSELETAKIPAEKESNALIEVLKNLNKTISEGQITTPQMINLIQEVSKISERMNILETKIEAVIKARGNFNEKHWLFGKFTEIVAEGIDENRGKIENLEAKLEKLTQQKSKRQQKNSKVEKKY